MLLLDILSIGWQIIIQTGTNGLGEDYTNGDNDGKKPDPFIQLVHKGFSQHN